MAEDSWNYTLKGHKFLLLGAISAVMAQYFLHDYYEFSSCPSLTSAIILSVFCWCIMNLLCINPLPDMPILGFSNSTANKDMMSKNGQIGVQEPGVKKYFGKRRNCSLQVFSFHRPLATIGSL